MTRRPAAFLLTSRTTSDEGAVALESTGMAEPPPTAVVLIPVFDDWRSLAQLLPAVARQLAALTASFGVLLVDDGSPSLPAELASTDTFQASWLRVLRLRRNVGHQRAIAIGLAYIDEHISCDAVIVMDADGEDRPEDLEALLKRFEADGRSRMVFATRARRAERLMFRLCYRMYQIVHLVLTGKGIEIGNFSVIPRARVSSLVVVSELWIHYAAAAVRSRQPLSTVPGVRGRRLDGRSHMGFVALVVHGLSAIAAYSDLVFTRLITGASVLAAAAAAGLAAVVYTRLFTSLAVPGWATFAFGLLLLVLLQTVMFAVGLIFQILGSRQYATVIPRRDYVHYVLEISDVGRPESTRT
jgi:hypothetical protein